jgi:PAS domain S-box-containing protein
LKTAIGTAFALQALEASPDCITVLASDGSILFINGRGVELNEFAGPNDVLGRRFADLWPESERAEVTAAVASAAGGTITRVEGFSPTANGLPRWWEVGFAPLTGDGGETRVVAISRDVSARYEARERTGPRNPKRRS